jgi:hypothetical protein
VAYNYFLCREIPSTILQEKGSPLVHPALLHYCNILTTSMGAGITKIVEKKHLKEWYKDKVVELEKEIHTKLMQASANWVFQKVVDFAFRAQSAIEWNKYCAQHTDRTCGKEKKMGQRDSQGWREDKTRQIVKKILTISPAIISLFLCFMHYSSSCYCRNDSHQHFHQIQS